MMFINASNTPSEEDIPEDWSEEEMDDAEPLPMPEWDQEEDCGE
ncbi:hypothetical protein OE749_06490 [Aestuariibacter sp. AA17]|uniref:Uncharacterized protein n=1 Tax=Fluctibacter corallii TaxID=2984329 RepID=A0ABT3A6W8_9ALTE|nr:hypothetical protein [Aestuariibacter sp. AA17]MCV2884338.1 hypothetical protein [Aestuariibacter sp. AA17]